MPKKIRKGDMVAVMAGKEKGKRGKVAKVLPGKNRVVVHGVNLVKRHVKPSQINPQGGIQDKEAPLNLSNVMIVDPSDNKPTRVGFEEKDGAWIRVSKRTGTEIPAAEAEA